MISDYNSIAKQQYHHVRVISKYQASHTGYLKVVDPISMSMILCDIEDSKVTKNILVLGHGIIGVERTNIPNSLKPDEVAILVEADGRDRLGTNPFFAEKYKDHNLTEEKLRARRDRIENWFKASRIPIEVHPVSNEIIVATTVRIRPPYDSPKDYVGSTSTITKRIIYLVKLALAD